MHLCRAMVSWDFRANVQAIVLVTATSSCPREPSTRPEFASVALNIEVWGCCHFLCVLFLKWSKTSEDAGCREPHGCCSVAWGLEPFGNFKRLGSRDLSTPDETQGACRSFRRLSRFTKVRRRLCLLKASRHVSSPTLRSHAPDVLDPARVAPHGLFRSSKLKTHTLLPRHRNFSLYCQNPQQKRNSTAERHLTQALAETWPSPGQTQQSLFVCVGVIDSPAEPLPQRCPPPRLRRHRRPPQEAAA